MEHVTRFALKPEAALLPGHDEAAMKTLRDRMNGYEDADLRSQLLRSGKCSSEYVLKSPYPLYFRAVYSH